MSSNQHRPEQSAGGCDRHCPGLPLRPGLSRIAASRPLIASTTHPTCWQVILTADAPAILWLRPVLRLAGCQPDAADVLSFWPVCAVEPSAQGQHDVFLRPLFQDRIAIGPGIVKDAAGIYYLTYSATTGDPGASAYWQYASGGTAVLAVRPAMVSVAASGAERAGCWAVPRRARMDRKPRQNGRPRRAAYPVRFFGGIGFSICAGLCPAGFGRSPAGEMAGSYGPFSFQIMPSAALSGFISSPVARLAPMASTAGCSPVTARWRGTGPAGLPLRSPALCCGRCR